jgi:hypothetical protein
MARNLVHQLPAAHVSGQRQPLLGQESQCTVNCGFGQAGQCPLSALTNLGGSQVAVCFPQDAQDYRALRSNAETAGMQGFQGMVFITHAKSLYCDLLQ